MALLACGRYGNLPYHVRRSKGRHGICRSAFHSRRFFFPSRGAIAQGTAVGRAPFVSPEPRLPVHRAPATEGHRPFAAWALRLPRCIRPGFDSFPLGAKSVSHNLPRCDEMSVPAFSLIPAGVGDGVRNPLLKPILPENDALVCRESSDLRVGNVLQLARIDQTGY